MMGRDDENKAKIEIMKCILKKCEEIHEKQKKLEAVSFSAKALSVISCVSNLLQVGAP